MASTLFSFRAEKGTRTLDLLITNELLYQLSYFGKQLFKSVAKIEQSFELYLFNCGFFKTKYCISNSFFLSSSVK